MLSFGLISKPAPPAKASHKYALSPNLQLGRRASSLNILGKHSSRKVISLAKCGSIKPVVDDDSASNIEVEYHQHGMASEEDNISAALQAGLKPELMPKYVSVIIDADAQRRWAEEKDYPVELGYVASRRPVERIVRLCCELEIKVLSVHFFGTEALQIPQEEIDFGMNLIEAAITTTLEELTREGIRISVHGNKDGLPKAAQEAITLVEETTKTNTKLHIIAFIENNNGLSNDEVSQAYKTLADKVKQGIVQPEDIDESIFQQYQMTNSSDDLPTPDLLIRTSGNAKLPNFKPCHQSAYSEIIFVEKHLTDFKEDDFIHVLDGFQARSKRFGGNN